jgi:hypothetical protein
LPENNFAFSGNRCRYCAAVVTFSSAAIFPVLSTAFHAVGFARLALVGRVHRFPSLLFYFPLTTPCACPSREPPTYREKAGKRAYLLARFAPLSAQSSIQPRIEKARPKITMPAMIEMIFGRSMPRDTAKSEIIIPKAMTDKNSAVVLAARLNFFFVEMCFDSGVSLLWRF